MPIVRSHPRRAKVYDYADGSYKITPCRILEHEGKTLIGYKKVRLDDANNYSQECEYGIVTLKIGPKTPRQQAKARKCRAAKATVVSIKALLETGYLGRHDTYNNKRRPKVAYSDYDPAFKYRIGKTVTPTAPYDPAYKECASGIHFFLTEQEALDYAI